MRKIYINKNIRTMAMIACTFIAAIGFIIFLRTMLKGRYEDKKEEILSYSNKAAVNYRVEVSPNSIYEEKNLGEGKVYITEYADTIHTVLNYYFQCQEQADVFLEYEVNAVMEGLLRDDKESKQIWSKKINLQPKTQLKLENNKFQKELPIDIKGYNHTIKEILAQLNANFNNRLTVVWDISIKGRSSKGEFFEKLSPTMEIPLGESYFEVNGQLSQDKKGSIEAVRKRVSTKYITNILISSLMLIVSVLCFIYILLLLVPGNGKSVSARRINRILKNYEEMLVALKDEPLEGSEAIIKVLDMNGLVKIADDLDKPIFYKYFMNIKDIKYFCVIDNKKAYVYQV